ncbi:hypothetical protein TTHERM_00049190 (macronuclear) [Tetrahymena thermophila SB210]|uniref:Uncharacterized protein n=1 Tax=Tetrahymena thermophila (strain SB210) TaxID=312017 RepID=Q23D72_TETTS|nr:hypothetical protein TTHERM_00049190 [Tetrahymena thermophila SB210]EAR94374.2 hypothetical protein TTHERM_00049190 [Tetrahymena thermophila SB210]|eukprot:XP_001014814.2 hypothetical protein TTHERM_00049190 [Tetrahymena thermophila SB210]
MDKKNLKAPQQQGAQGQKAAPQGQEQAVARQGVKFADQKNRQGNLLQPAINEDIPLDISNLKYKNANDTQEYCLDVFNQVEISFKKYLENDPKVKRKDTAKALKSLLDMLKKVLAQLNLGTFEDKVKNYYLTYNATIYVIDICQFLRKSVYSALCVDYIAFCIVSLEGNIILIRVKYIEWRVKMYIELANVYNECGSISAASKTIELALNKVLESKALEEKDPPLPDYMQKLFTNNLRILRSLDLKYKLQSQTLNVEAWKKKVEEVFADDPEGKCIAVVESLRCNNSKFSNTVERKGAQFSWKEGALQASYDIFKQDIDLVVLALEQQNKKIEREIEASKINFSNLTQEQKVELKQKNDEFNSGLVKEKEWKKASARIPLEYHIELIHYAYEVRNEQVFDELTRTALVRTTFRRLEVPYIVDIDIIADYDPNPNIPNGYERIPIDINEASLRMELKKLRNKNKGNKGGASQQTEKKEEEKKDDKKKNDKANAQKGGQATNAVSAQQNQQQLRLARGIDATPEELAEINHVYVYLVIKRSANPEGAIYDMDIIMYDEQDERGPYQKIKEGWKAIAIPVKQYTGVQETTHNIPYLLIKHSAESLKNEDEKITLISDVRPLFGRNPLIRPDVGFNKIECDLRQVPKEFIRSPNMEYVYLTFKKEDFFFVNERELLIMVNFMNLERTFGRDQIKTLEDEKRVELDLVYDINKLEELIKTVKDTLVGPLGQQFYVERKDFLCNLAFYIWNKYITSQLYQIEFVYEQRLCEEITDKIYEQYRELIVKSRPVFTEALKVFNKIMLRNPEADILWVSKYNIELTRLLEEQEEFKQASQNLRECLQRIVAYRDQFMERGVESQRDKFLPFTITCNNRKIKETIQKMKESYVETKNKLNAQIRYNKRLKTAQNAGKKFVDLEKDEQKEEEYESLSANWQYLQDDNTDSHYFKALENLQGFSETEMLINALHADIIINIFRCELKLGRQQFKVATQKSKDVKATRQENKYMTKSQAQRINNIPLNEDYGNLPDKDKLKATMIQGDTTKQVKSDYVELKTELQNAGQLEPPKPQMQSYEDNLINEQMANPYTLSLLYMMIASNKIKQPEQQYLLQKAFSYIKDAEQMESLHTDNCIKDSIYIFSTLLDNYQTNQNWSKYFPFDHLYKSLYIQKSNKPRKPILICRNSTSITFKLPPFAPQLTEMEANKNPKKLDIKKMAIFGKKSENGVDVSNAQRDLYNTGLMQEIGAVLTIKHLVQNEKYCFAVEAYDANEEASQIGETGEDVLCLHPLPINLLSSYLAKHAYQMGDFKRAKEAANHTFSYFTEKSEFIDRHLDYQQNSLYLYRLKQQAIQEVSFIELQALTETFIIKARCLKRDYFADGSQGGTTMKDDKLILSHQRNILKVCNYLLLAQETSLCIRNYPLAKRLATEQYNQIIELLQMQTKTTSIFHILLKIQILITEIPRQYWDRNLRILSSKITYEICKLSLQFNEVNLGKRVLYAESKLFNRKWYAFSKIIEVIEESEVQQKDGDAAKKAAAAKKDTKKPANKKDDKKDVQDAVNQADQIQKQKTVKKLIRELFETQTTVQNFLEEALLSFPEDYGDYVQRFIDRWKEMIEGYLPFVENSQEDKDRMIQNLSQHFDYWECFKDLKSAFVGKVQANFKTNPRYLEICCKLFRRMLEAGFSANYVSNCIAQVTVDPASLSDAFNLAKDIKDLKIKAIENNIEWYPAILNYLIMEKQTNKQGEDTAIEIFQQYFSKLEELHSYLYKEEMLELYGVQYQNTNNAVTPMQSQQNIPTNQISYFISLHQRFQYLNLWHYEFNFLKALTTFIKHRQYDPEPQKNDTEPKLITINDSKEMTREIYYNVFLLDVNKIETQITQIKKNPQSVQEDEKAFIKNMEQVFEHLSLAVIHATNAKAWLSVQNIAIYIYNILVSEMVNPFISQGNKIWINLSIVSYCLIELLSNVKKEGLYSLRHKQTQNQKVPLETRQSMRYQGQDGKTSRVQFEDEQDLKVKYGGAAIHQVDISNPNSYILPKLDQIISSKEFWFDNEKDLNIEVLANVVAFTTQVLMVEQKWNVLIGITRSFCNDSQHYYSKYILPFTNYAQKKIYKEANLRTIAKINELAEEERLYNEWKKGRRKTRAAMMTGEIPPEQIKFENTKKELEEQIKLLKQKEDFILAEMNLSSNLIQQVGEMNEALKLLQQVRLDLRNFGNELKVQNIGKFIEDIFPREEGYFKKNITKVQNSQFQETFQKILKLLQSKSEKTFAITLAKKEFGNLKFSQSQTNPTGDDMWKEAVDKIFNNSSSLKEYRLKVRDESKTIARQIGITEMLVGSNIICNLGYIFYFKQLNQMRDATLLAAEMVFSIFRISLPHPLIAVEYGTYRLRELCLKENIFKDPWTLDPVETLLSMERLAWNLIDNEMSLKALPPLCLMDYIATDVCQSAFYSVRAKIMKSIALANIGYINESYFQLQKVIKEKDLPLRWLKPTEYLMRERGNNWFPEGEGFNNSSHPYQEKNREIIEILAGKEKSESAPQKGDAKGDQNANKGDLMPKNFHIKYGQLNVNLFQYARANLLFAVNENEIFENFELNQIRNEYLKQSENQLRKLLKKISFEEEIGLIDWQIEKYTYYLQNHSGSGKDQQSEQNAENTLNKLKQERRELFAKREIDKKDEEEYLKNKEESLDYVNKREERLTMMCRSRFLIHKINQAQNLFTRCYHILSYGISNLFQYCNEYRYVESGEEQENLDLDNIKLQEEAVAGQPAKGGKNAAPPKKEPPAEKKDQKKGGKPEKVDLQQEANKQQEEKKRREELEKERSDMLKKAEERKYRRHLSVFWWIKLRTEMCLVLFKQNRLQDCETLIEITKKDCTQVKDYYYYDLLEQLTARLLVKKGKISEANKKFEETKIHLEKNSLNDTPEYVIFLGDFGELVYERGFHQGALNLFKEAMQVAEKLLEEISYDYQLQNANKKAFDDGVQICTELQLPSEIEEEILKKTDRLLLNTKGANAAAAKKDVKKGKEDPKAKKNDKKGAVKVEEVKPDMKVDPLNPIPQYDLMKEVKYTYANLDIEILNNTKHIYNSYIKNVALYMRACLRYVNCYFTLYTIGSELDENVLEILKKLEKINELSINFIIPISFRIELQYLFALYHKYSFYREIYKIQGEYIKKYVEGKKSSDEEKREIVKKYRKLATKKPHRDICRNKYLVDVPNFSQLLKESLIGYLDESQRRLDSALSILGRGECLFLEFNRLSEDIFLENSEISLLKREYKPRIGYKYFDLSEIQQLYEIINKDKQENLISQEIESLNKNDQSESHKLEQEAFKYLKHSIKVSDLKFKLKEFFTEEAKQPLTSVEKLPLDIYFDVIESDYLYKKDYNMVANEGVVLFDETKKKSTVNTVDLLMQLVKLQREAQIFTFNNPYIQNKISKLHRFLKQSFPNYLSQYIIQSIETYTINPGNILVKSIYYREAQEYKFLYILGPLDKTKIVNVDQESINKIIINEEKDVLYGSIYMSEVELDNLFQRSLDLKTNMTESDKKSQAAKERDYKSHKKNFRKLIEDFGSYFFQKDDSTSDYSHQQLQRNVSFKESEGEETDYLGKYEVLVPELTHDSIKIFIDLFNFIGLDCQNQNVLGIFRYFHHQKYQ